VPETHSRQRRPIPTKPLHTCIVILQLPVSCLLSPAFPHHLCPSVTSVDSQFSASLHVCTVQPPVSRHPAGLQQRPSSVEKAEMTKQNRFDHSLQLHQREFKEKALAVSARVIRWSVRSRRHRAPATVTQLRARNSLPQRPSLAAALSTTGTGHRFHTAARDLDFRPWTFDLRPSTFDLGLSTFDLGLSTFDLGPSTFDLGPGDPADERALGEGDIEPPAMRPVIRPPRAP
jgi:hypothetical protein